MKSFRRILSSPTGNSLVEIMIALALTGIITTAVLGLYYRQHSNYMVQDDITAVQQNARASIDEITRQVRMAGYDLPAGVAPLVASNTNPDTITLHYSASGCETYLSSPMPQPSAELKCATDVSCFEDGQWAYIFHPDSGGGDWFEITHVQTGSRHIQHNTMPLSQAYDEDAILIGLTQIKFYIDQSTDANHPSLIMEMPGHGPQVYADNVSDLQFRYRLENGNIVDNPVLIDNVVEVLVTVTAQSQDPDYEKENPEKRQRTYASSVSLRNVGL